MTIDSKNLLVAIKAYSRANPLPLDASEVHDSLTAAQEYAASAKAYPGQTIKVLQNGIYETYVLNPSDSGLTLGKVTVDDSQLKNYVQVVETLPESGQEQGVIYIDSNLSGQIWTGSAWKVIFEQIELEEGKTVSVSEAVRALSTEISDVQELVDVLNGDSSTEGSVDYKIAAAIVNADHLKRKIVTELPQENIDTNTIYMISARENGEDIYNEYMYIDGKWEVLGNTTVDLSDYYTKEEVNSTFATIASLSNYALKSELPTVPTKVSELENDLGFLTEHQDLSDYALKSELPDVSDFVKQNELQNYVTLGTYNSAIDNLNSQTSALAALIGDAATKAELNEVKENYALKSELPNLDDYTTKTYVTDYVAEAIANAKLEGGEGSDIDLSIYAKKTDLGNYSGFDTVIDYVNAAVSTASVQVVEF